MASESDVFADVVVVVGVNVNFDGDGDLDVTSNAAGGEETKRGAPNLCPTSS